MRIDGYLYHIPYMNMLLIPMNTRHSARCLLLRARTRVIGKHAPSCHSMGGDCLPPYGVHIGWCSQHADDVWHQSAGDTARGETAKCSAATRRRSNTISMDSVYTLPDVTMTSGFRPLNTLTARMNPRHARLRVVVGDRRRIDVWRPMDVGGWTWRHHG